MSDSKYSTCSDENNHWAIESDGTIVVRGLASHDAADAVINILECRDRHREINDELDARCNELRNEKYAIQAEVERLTEKLSLTKLFPPIVESNAIPEGQAVLVNIYQHQQDAEEIKRLKAEVGRLKVIVLSMTDEAFRNARYEATVELPEGWNSSVANAVDLLAEKDKEIERLREAGDEMTKYVGMEWCPSWVVKDWEDAKKGDKQ